MPIPRRGAFGFPGSLEVRQVLGEGPLRMIFEGISYPGLTQLCLLDQIIQHLLRSGLVRGQRDSLANAVNILELPVPGWRLQLDPVPRLRERGRYRLAGLVLE